MKKLLIAYILFQVIVLIPSQLIAQLPKEKIHLLQSKLNDRKDTTEVNLILELSWNYRNIDADSALFYAKKGCDLAKEIDYKAGCSRAMNFMGIAHRNKSEYSKAMTLYFDALKISEEEKNAKEISYTLLNIGNIYVIQGDFKGGLEYFERALQYALDLTDSQLTAYCHLHIGRSLAGLKRYSDADVHFTQAKKLREASNDLEAIVIVNNELADLYMAMKKPDDALVLLKDNLKNIHKLSHYNTLADNYFNTAKALRLKEDLDASLMYSEMALDISRKHNLKSVEILVLKNKAEILEQLGKTEYALYTFKQYIGVKDSVFSEENTRKIANIYNTYTSEKSESEKKTLQAQTEIDQTTIHRQQTVIFLAAVSAVLFLVMAIMAYKSYIQKNRLNEQIQKQKENAYRHNNKLIDLNNEKNNLIRILSHDLRSPINNIKGLTMVHQMDHADQFSEAENHTLNLIKSESDRLLNMISKILNVESLDNDESNIKLEKLCINTVTEEVVTGYKNTAKNKNIELEIEIPVEPIYVLGDQIHLHQVLENLLSNAIKFSESDKKININLSKHGSKVRAAVKDQGPGLTEEDKAKIFKKFQRLSAKPTGNEESTGLGLSIVKKYVEEMNGRIWHESQEGKGTTFIVELDIIEEDTEKA
ncbi:tetratricopeptide repeat-containing sensor histidine kinase [Reichenbachiella versicolor]|uniref:tetratricopeptide repeat-containing sensor histidine kinase n=1 Tax=Reichenbachiella versicolor TaxID=1821036 RepID=UPI000D6E8150|nr:ATP-binding protein [Reichenbachiella versicolor]